MQNKIEAVAKGIDSLQNLFIGMLVALIASILLITNEVDTIKHAQVMDQGANNVISIKADESINPANNGKLIFTSGMAMSMNSVKDNLFNVSTQGLRLWRIVQMYQWNEKEESSSSSSSSKKTYYTKEWLNKYISSTDTSHKNPIMPIIGDIINADTVSLGNFTLSYDLIAQIQNWQRISVSDANVPTQYNGKMKVVGDTLYLGKDPNTPEIGDIKISFQYVDATLISVVAKQNGDILEPFGIDDNTIAIIESGIHTVEDLFQSDKKMSTFSSWNFRIGGFAFMFVAAFILQTSLINLLNKIAGTNTLRNLNSKKVTILLGSIMSLLAMAFGWVIAYVPFVKYIILVLFLIGFGKVSYKIFKKLTSSKSIFAKIILVIITLIILIIILVILTFIYLTRAG